jgi:hypothetical protein
MNTKVTCQEFINRMVNLGFTALHLPSGKTRFIKDNQSYLYNPVEAIRYNCWFNEQTLYYESFNAGSIAQ